MGHLRQETGLILLGALCLAARAEPIVAQEPFGVARSFELAESVAVDAMDQSGRAQLTRAEADVTAGRWETALGTLGQVVDRYGDRVIQIDQGCYVTVRCYVQARIAALPAAARARYRMQVDGLARRWYNTGVARRDPALLGRVVDQLLCSSWGDEALLALGEIALERGWYGAARAAWERISRAATDGLRPSPTGTASGPAAGTARQNDAARVYYPDTNLKLADIQARLILVSILAGDLDRAQMELQRFGQLHPGARGYLAGGTVRYGVKLAALLAAARSWPPSRPRTDWTTLAGSPARTTTRPALRPVAGLAWSVSLAAGATRKTTQVAGQNVCRQVPFFPVVVGDLLLVNDQTRILAFDRRTGKPAWGKPSAVLFEGERLSRPLAYVDRGKLGVPRFTMTAWQGRLFARMGPPTTSVRLSAARLRPPGYLVCLDLMAHGRLLWKVPPDGPSWAFEGSPLVANGNVYVGMRRSDVRPQAHVACLDARSGRVRWRRFICAAETPAQGQIDQITCNLLTLAEGTLYYNTNLGAVAAVSARTGTVRWIRLYPRDRRGDLRHLAPHFRRDLNPCVYYRGQLLVAPSDSREVFALSAATGRRQWGTAAPADVTDLIGVHDGVLFASGQRLWWLDTRDGRVIWRWPESQQSGLRPCGRAALAGAAVYWPMADSIRVFPCHPTTPTRELREPIRLAPFGARGGNLSVVDGALLVAGPRAVYKLTDRAPRAGTPEHGVTHRPARIGTVARTE